RFHHPEAAVGCSPTAAEMAVKQKGYVSHHFYAVLVVVVSVEDRPDIGKPFDQGLKAFGVDTVDGPLNGGDMAENKNIPCAAIFFQLLFKPVHVWRKIIAFLVGSRS